MFLNNVHDMKTVTDELQFAQRGGICNRNVP